MPVPESPLRQRVEAVGRLRAGRPPPALPRGQDSPRQVQASHTIAEGPRRGSDQHPAAPRRTRCGAAR
jgi:hypothetical protein